MLGVKGGMNGCLIFFMLIAFVVWVMKPLGFGELVWQREWSEYVVAMLALTVAIFISQSIHVNYDAKYYDAASRFWMGIPVFLLLIRLQPQVFRALDYAFPIAAIMGYVLSKDMGGRLGISTLDLIHFGDFELILAMLSLLSINWLGKDKPHLWILKISGFLFGLGVSIASGSRGGWLAIPVFIMIVVYFSTSKIALKFVVAGICATLFAALISISSNSIFLHRLNQLGNEITLFEKGELDTSTGIRWQLYKAAGDIFIRHPIFGAGPAGFAIEMKPMADAGKITPEAAELGRGEVHNDILAKTAGMGVFGLAAILAIYFVPFRMFWRATKAHSSQVSRAGIMGITFVSGFTIFGFTVEILNLTMATAFYSVTVAVLLAVCNNTRGMNVKSP